MKRHAKSHLDHGLTRNQIEFIFDRYTNRQDSFLLETIELPADLGMAPCGLWGPIMGDPEILNGGEVLPLAPGEYITNAVKFTISANQVKARYEPFDGKITLGKRSADRTWNSRLINLPMRPVKTVTVIGGTYEDQGCILFTAYGGPPAPREPGDPSLVTDSMKADAIGFWTRHALSRYSVR